jgi:outer membrane biogenesis lipoprotein LolB
VGAPRPGSPGARLVRADAAAGGHIDVLEQDGWQVRYDQYRDFDGWILPRKLELTSPDVRVRMVIRDWRIVENE